MGIQGVDFQFRLVRVMTEVWGDGGLCFGGKE